MNSKRYVSHEVFPEYRAWIAMKGRCFNKNNSRYENYGGRGITVCDRWLGKEGYDNFYNDLGPRPSPDHSLDRYPNNDGNYEPGNCRWATREQQQDNRRNTVKVSFHGKTMTAEELSKLTNVKRRLITNRAKAGDIDDDLIRDTSRIEVDYKGKKYTLSELSKLTGVDRSVIYDRYARQGKSIEEAVTPHHLFNYPTYEYKGEFKTIPHISRESGIPEGTIRQRLSYGVTGEDLFKTSRPVTLYLYRGEKYSIPQLEAITRVSKTTLARHLGKMDGPVDEIVDRLINKLGLKKFKDLDDAILKGLKKSANKMGLPLPSDMIMVPNPENPGKKMWVPKPGWKPYDV